ncbi:MAG: alpha/beta hydrolase [Bacteroidales bacterium]
MKLLFCLWIWIGISATQIFAQDTIMELWPQGPPVENGLSGPETDLGNNRVGNISRATAYIYFPESAHHTGAALIMLPGGGYRREAMSHEGYEVGAWLKEKGITGIVLKYRLPNGHPEVPLQDAARAIRLVRQHAEEWGLDPGKIGIGGASAGGHLASVAGTRFDEVPPGSADRSDTCSSRPDFMLLLYPLIYFREGDIHPSIAQLLFGGDTSWPTVSKYSSELNVTESTPPAFIVLADNDPAVDPSHSMAFYQALKQHGIHAEMHIFQQGGHGFGITKQGLPSDRWPELFYDWLESGGIVE